MALLRIWNGVPGGVDGEARQGEAPMTGGPGDSGDCFV